MLNTFKNFTHVLFFWVKVCNILPSSGWLTVKFNIYWEFFFNESEPKMNQDFGYVHSSCTNMHMYTNPQSNAVIKSKCSLPVVWLLYPPLAVMKQKNIKYLRLVKLHITCIMTEVYEQCDGMTELTMIIWLILMHLFESHDHDELTDFDKFDWKSW